MWLFAIGSLQQESLIDNNLLPMDKEFPSCEPKQTFPLLNFIILGFHSNEKLTNIFNAKSKLKWKRKTENIKEQPVDCSRCPGVSALTPQF